MKALLLVALLAGADERVDRLPEDYKDWIESVLRDPSWQSGCPIRPAVAHWGADGPTLYSDEIGTFHGTTDPPLFAPQACAGVLGNSLTFDGSDYLKINQQPLGDRPRGRHQ